MEPDPIDYDDLSCEEVHKQFNALVARVMAGPPAIAYHTQRVERLPNRPGSIDPVTRTSPKTPLSLHYLVTFGPGVSEPALFQTRWSCGLGVAYDDFLKTREDFLKTREDRSRWPLSDMIGITSYADAFMACTNWQDRSIKATNARAWIARHYKPQPADVLGSCLIDLNSVEYQDDWVGWAEDCGSLSERVTAEEIRELMTAWNTIQNSREPLRRLFGCSFQHAIQLAARR